MVSVVGLFMDSVVGFVVESAAAGGSNILERIERFLVFVCVFLAMVSVAGFFMISVVAGKHFGMVSVVGLFMVSVVARNILFMVSVVGCVLMVSGCYRTSAFSPMETITNKSGRFRDELSICKLCVYMYTYMYIYI